MHSQDSKVVDAFILLSIFWWLHTFLIQGTMLGSTMWCGQRSPFVAVTSERVCPETRRTKYQKWFEVGEPRAQEREDWLNFIFSQVVSSSPINVEKTPKSKLRDTSQTVALSARQVSPFLSFRLFLDIARGSSWNTDGGQNARWMCGTSNTNIGDLIGLGYSARRFPDCVYKILNRLNSLP